MRDGANTLRAQKDVLMKAIGHLGPVLLSVGYETADVWQYLVRKIREEAAPFLAAYRFTASGMKKLEVWQTAWALQRREDAGEVVQVPVPHRYAQGDFNGAYCWRLRGKLDVPKERFISYPGCESDEDGEPLYGWAGWNHAERAQALAALYVQRKGESWQVDRLTPMLAGLLELLPWVKQWHNEPNQDFGGLKLGDYYEDYIASQCRELGLTEQDLRDWRPAEKKRSRRHAASGKRKPATSTGKTAE